MSLYESRGDSNRFGVDELLDAYMDEVRQIAPAQDVSFLQPVLAKILKTSMTSDDGVIDVKGARECAERFLAACGRMASSSPLLAASMSSNLIYLRMPGQIDAYMDQAEKFGCLNRAQDPMGLADRLKGEIEVRIGEETILDIQKDIRALALKTSVWTWMQCVRKYRRSRLKTLQAETQREVRDVARTLFEKTKVWLVQAAAAETASKAEAVTPSGVGLRP